MKKLLGGILKEGKKINVLSSVTILELLKLDAKRKIKQAEFAEKRKELWGKIRSAIHFKLF